MAAVYLARDAELDRLVAVKVLNEDLAADGELARRFRREALTAARLSHPNVVGIYDAGEDDGRHFLVMEYVDGEGLDAVRAREGTLPADRVLELGSQAAGALGYAHEHGVVHRDVKPANLLLRADGTLKVTDFGIAHAADATQITRAGTVLGTASYIAPEQARGEPAGPQADVFSLGVVLYELLTGTPPWRIQTLAELATVGEQPARPVRDFAPETPAALEAAVMRCLARNPAYRPVSGNAVRAELRADAGEPPTVRLPPPAPAPDPRPAPARPPASAGPVTRRPQPAATQAPSRRRRKRPLVRGGLVLAAVALLLAGAGYLVWAGGGDPPPRPVQPVPQSDDVREQVRNLRDWLREYTADE